MPNNINIIASMSLEEKLGQLFSCNIRAYDCELGSSGFKQIESIIRKHHIGGLLVFHGEAYKSALLLKELQNISKLPLLLASDIERGVGQIFEGAFEFPTNMAIAATGDTNLAYRLGRLVALEARAMGIHIAYSPVCDINTNADNPIINTRSFGDEPGAVASFVKEYIRGIEEGGILATAKHFPGHGAVSLDSHSDLPILRVDKELLLSRELVPFRAAISAGVSQIMTAHISLPLLTGEDGLPATLSSVIIKDLLRGELGFDGLVVSDALNMGGIARHFSRGEAVVRTLKAGVDILLYPGDLPPLISAIKSAIEKGELVMEDINASVNRVLGLKERLGLFADRSINIASLDSSLCGEEARKLADLIARSSLTLLGANALAFSLSAEDIQCIVFDEDGDARLSFVEELQGRIGAIRRLIISPDNASQDIDTSFINTCPTIVLIYSKIKAWKGAAGLSSGLLARLNSFLHKLANLRNKKVIVISFASPYIYNELDIKFSFIAAYSHSYYSQIACVKALEKGFKFRGRLPISLSL